MRHSILPLANLNWWILPQQMQGNGSETVWWFSHDILDDIAIAVRETLLYGGEGNGT